MVSPAGDGLSPGGDLLPEVVFHQDLSPVRKWSLSRGGLSSGRGLSPGGGLSQRWSLNVHLPGIVPHQGVVSHQKVVSGQEVVSHQTWWALTRGGLSPEMVFYQEVVLLQEMVSRWSGLSPGEVLYKEVVSH